MHKILILFIISLINLYAVNFSKLQLSGDVNYEIEKPQKVGSDNGSEGEAEHDIDLDLKLSYPLSKVSEFIIKVNDTNENDENGSAVDLETDQIYVTYEQQTLSAQFGLQEITGPFFYEQNGDGLLILKSFKTSILAASYYINNTFSKSDEVYQIALIGETNSFSYAAWYSTLKDATETSTDYGATVAQISLFRQSETSKIGFDYTVLEPESGSSRASSEEQTQAVIYLKNEDKTIQYEIAYIETGENGANVALDEQTDSSANYSLDEVGANDIDDGKAYYIMISKDLTKTTKVTFQYFNGDGSTSAEEMKLTYTSYIDKDLYYYASMDRWNKSSEDDSEKLEIGFNISF